MISFGESLKKSIEDEEDDGEDDFDAGNKLEFQEKTKHAFKIQSCFEVRRKPTYVLCVQSDSTRLSKKYSYLPMQYSYLSKQYSYLSSSTHIDQSSAHINQAVLILIK